MSKILEYAEKLSQEIKKNPDSFNWWLKLYIDDFIKKEKLEIEQKESTNLPPYYIFKSDPIPGVCKQYGIWVETGNNSYPLVYFQKPKWIDDKHWDNLIANLAGTIKKEPLEEVLKTIKK